MLKLSKSGFLPLYSGASATHCREERIYLTLQRRSQRLGQGVEDAAAQPGLPRPSAQISTVPVQVLMIGGPRELLGAQDAERKAGDGDVFAA